MIRNPCLLIFLSAVAWAQESAIATDLIDVFTEPYRVIEVAAAEPGILQKLHVRQGDHVRAGELIANLDQDVLLVSLEIASMRATLSAHRKKAQAEVGKARRRYEKIRGLHANGHASEEELETAKSTLELAAAGLLEVEENKRLAKLEMKRIEAQLRRRQITSSVTGQVVELKKDEGEYVASLEPVVAKIVQLNKLRVKFYVDTASASQMASGSRLALYFPESSQRTTGTIEFVSPLTEADSRTVRVEVAIENESGMFRSGVPVRLESPQQARK